MSTKMTTREQNKSPASAARRATRTAKWPPSLKSLRAKHPNGVLVRACFTIGGRTVEHNGVVNEEFLKLVRAVFDMSAVN